MKLDLPSPKQQRTQKAVFTPVVDRHRSTIVLPDGTWYLVDLRTRAMIHGNC